MKNISKLIVALLFILVGVSSCKKEESKIFFKGGTEPTLQLVNLYSGSSDLLTLKKADADKPALNIKWTNPEYTLTTGVSSLDVNYVLEMDSSGNAFTNENAKIYSQPIDLGVVLTVAKLNELVIKLGLDTSVAKKLDFRVTAAIKEPAEAKYFALSSEIQTIWVKTFYIPPPPPPELYITGSATPSSWTNAPPSTQKFDYDATTKKFTIVITLKPNEWLKFLAENGKWAPQYGLDTGNENGGTLAYRPTESEPDPPAIPSGAGGTKTIVVDTKARTFTVN